jgi:hypothetical protein
VALALDSFDQMQVLVSAAPDQDDVARGKLPPGERLDRDVAAVLDFPDMPRGVTTTGCPR